MDRFNDTCILDGSSRVYIEAYEKSKKLRPTKWSKKVVLLNDVSVYGNQCLLYAWPHSCFLVGDSINWNMRKCPVEHPSNTQRNLISEEKMLAISEGIILQSRGFRVYGHWLLDYLPRLLIIREYCKAMPSLPIIVRNIPRWAKIFILRLGITNPIVSVPEGGELQAKLLHIPLIMKESSFYYEPILAESFSMIRHLFTNTLGTKASCLPKKIFFARKKAPFAVNQDEAIDFYSKYGFQCIYPEQLSLEEQIAMYSGCRIFIGEDSSAMHNMGFASHSSSLIFSRRNRVNLWHAAVASSTGQKIRPVQSTIVSSDGRYQVPLSMDLLDGL